MSNNNNSMTNEKYFYERIIVLENEIEEYRNSREHES
jgi:hypothetical protein